MILYEKLGVPNRFFPVMVIVCLVLILPGNNALSLFLLGMLLCILSSRRIQPWAKVLWSLSFLPFHVVAASIYYFAVYRREAPEMRPQHA